MSEQVLNVVPLELPQGSYPVPVASDRGAITVDDIESLFPALRKLKITKDDPGTELTVEATHRTFISARLAFNQQLQALMQTDVENKAKSSKKGKSVHHPSHKSRQELFDSLQLLARSEAEMRSKLVIIQGMIVHEKHRIDGIYNGLLMKTQTKIQEIEQTLVLYDAFHNCRTNGSISNVGYDIETDLTHAMKGRERANVRILIPLETKKKALQHILDRYRENWTKTIVLGGQEQDWCNIIVSWLKRDIFEYKNSTMDHTDWRKVYQLYEFHNDLGSFPDCKELALQLRAEWLHYEVTHAIHEKRVQEERKREAYRKEQERLAKEKESTPSSSSVPTPTPSA